MMLISLYVNPVMRAIAMSRFITILKMRRIIFPFTKTANTTTNYRNILPFSNRGTFCFPQLAAMIVTAANNSNVLFILTCLSLIVLLLKTHNVFQLTFRKIFIFGIWKHFKQHLLGFIVSFLLYQDVCLAPFQECHVLIPYF